MASRTTARNAAIRASAEPTVILARRFGLDPSHISRIRSSAPPQLSRRERFRLEVIEGGWVAACMDPDEWALWVERNPMALVDVQIADRPCRDCPLEFAAEMRAIGRCNGTPSGAPGEPAERDEEEDVIESRPGGVRGQPQPLALSMPPCETCLHEPICVLKVALKRATSIEVSPLPLPDGLTVQVSAAVECRFWTRQPRKLNLSPEERERRGRRIQAGLSAHRAKSA